MTPDSPNSPREELEARLTALLLGELSAEDAAALRQAIDQDPELARLENQLKETIGLVREAADSQDEKSLEPAAALQLSAERREKLLASFKTAPLPVPAKPRRKFRLNRELLKLAAMVVALLLVGGVLISYFTSKVAVESADAGELAQGAYFAGVHAGESERVEVVRSRVDPYVNGAPVEGGRANADALYRKSTSAGLPPTPPSIALFGGSDPSRVQVSGQVLAINGQAPENRYATFGDSLSAAQKALEQQRRMPGIQAPPAPTTTPANKQLAQDARGFRASIALPKSSEGQPTDEWSDASGVAVRNADPVGRASSRADDFASVALTGSGKVEVEELSKAQSRTGLSTGGGFGNRSSASGLDAPAGGLFGRGGMGGGADPVHLPALEGKYLRAGKESGVATATPAPSTPPLGDLAAAKTSDPAAANSYWGRGSNGAFTDFNRNGAVAAESFWLASKETAAAKPPMSTANSDWFGTTDVNGPAPAPAHPLSRTFSRAKAKSVNAPEPAIAANPVPAVDPATGLPAASASAGMDSTLMGFWDTGIDTERRPAPAPVAAQPSPSPTKQAPPAVATTAGVLSFETATPSAPSRDGQTMAGEQVTDLAAVVDVDTPQMLAGRETVQRTPVRTLPSRPIRPATKPAETPAPDQKPEATKSTSFADDVDMLLKKPEGNAVLAFTTPAPAVPAMPAPATEPTRELKTKSTESAQNLRAIDDLAQKNEQDAPVMLSVTVTNIAFFDSTYSVGANVSDGLEIGHGQHTAGIGGVPIADPNFGTGGAREWGIRQKLDTDGDKAARLEGLNQSVKDLTKSKSKKAFLEVQDGQLNPRNPHFGNQPQDESRWNFGMLFDTKQLPDQNRLPRTAEAEFDHMEAPSQPQSGKKALAQVQDKLGKAERAEAGGVHSANAVGYVNQSIPPLAVMPAAVADEERKKENETAGSTITVNRVNGSDGRVLVEYETDAAFTADRRTNRITAGWEFTTLNDSQRGSEDSVSRRSRVEIALPPGGENVQAVEREPRMQTGPVAINEVMYNAPEKQKANFASRLNQAGNRAANGSSESLRAGQRAALETAAELARLRGLSNSLQSMNGDDLKTVLLTGAAGPEAASVLQSLSEEAKRRGIPATELFKGPLDERLEAVRADVKAKMERLQSELAGETTPVQEFTDVVIPLKTAPAADVARMLQSSAANGELAGGRPVKVIPDERTHSLLIFASKEDLNSISNAIKRLDAPVPQGEVETAENNFSTFSLNVSDVSFKLAAASLEKGQMPDPATVRSEEFINAFDYRDPEPKGSAPIAFAWERARYPFAHNRDLLRFSVKTAASGRQPGRPLNLVLLLDNSGSMERADRVSVIGECIRVLTGQLQPQDRVSVVAFARTARLAVDGLTGTNIVTLPQEIGQLAPDGGTNLEEAMNLAYKTALKHFQPNGVNRVVLLTDGAANLGDVEPESLKKKVESHRKQGVALDCFGIGWDGYNDDLLEVLSRNGDGRYGFVNTPEAAASEFAGQLAGALRVAASDVKVQVEFNPRRVTAYRQIGYAKHQLKKEQFRDNTVDAAEIGAAEQGNALYTVQVNPSGEGPLGIVRVRFKVPGTSDYREHEWALPYSGAATPLEQSSPALRLAATASAFSEWLVSSPFAAEVTPDRLLSYLSGVPETSTADPRPKKLEWMIRQARSLAGK